jgi:hypothetical protein
MTRSLTVSWDDPHAAFAAGKALAGIDYMKEMIAGRIAPPPIMRLMGFRLAQVGEGLAIFECEPAEQHYNPIGVVHGGLAMTLLDSAMGCCVHTRLPAGTGYTTLEGEPGARDHGEDRDDPRHRQGDPLRRQDRDRRRPPGGCRRQAPRPRHHDLHHPGVRNGVASRRR